jgi:methylated-DNA-[protein]-cysteine S-methyltransferase
MEKIRVNISEMKDSPLGTLMLAETEKGAWKFAFGLGQDAFLALLNNRGHPDSVTWQDAPHPALQQIAAYLKGEILQLDIPVDYAGLTEFQTAVYQAVSAVPYGQTATYKQVAKAIGRPKASRAVGAANGANPLPLIIPCHRLVGADGGLHGYGGVGGLKTKRWLLDLESSNR